MKAVYNKIIFAFLGSASLIGARSVDRFDARCFIKTLWQQQSMQAIDSFFTRETARLMIYDPQTIALSVCRAIAGQCKIVHVYLKRFSICLSDHSLLYGQEQGGQLQSNEPCEPLIAYWKSRNFVALFSFYTWYFDCLSRLFIASLDDVYRACKGLSYEKHYAQAEGYYQAMLELAIVFQDTVHEERYAQYIHRYTNLLEYVRELCKLSAV